MLLSPAPKSVVDIRFSPLPASPGWLLRIIQVHFWVKRCERSGRTLTVLSFSNFVKFLILLILFNRFLRSFDLNFFKLIIYLFLSLFWDFLLRPQVQGSCVWNLDKFAVEYFQKSRLSFKRFEMEDLFIHRRNESNDSNVNCYIFWSD
jgi:hypothetical protein